MDPSVSGALKAQIPLIQHGISKQLLCSLQQLAKSIQENLLGNASKTVISTNSQDR